MTHGQITASDISGWDSLDDIADSFAKRGLKPRPDFGADNELVLQLADDEFIMLVEAGPGESATDFKPQDTDRRHTNLVATNDFEEFTFITRIRTFGQQHGQIKHQKLSFSKSQFTSEGGEKHTILQKLNEIEYGASAAIYGDLYDTKQIVQEFYTQFEDLRTDLVKEVSGIPGDRGDAKQRYVQVTLDRMIFLYFIQEKRLLDRDPEYLHQHHDDVVAEGGDTYEDFYEPLFFDLLAEGKQDPEFGSLPYLNGGLFTTNPVEEEFPDARLGNSVDETNELFGRILDFLSEWNWNVDERLDIVDPKNLSPAVLGHIFEQTVNQKEMGAYYTPEEITGFMARRSIHPYLLDQLNEAVAADYEEIDEVFALDEVDPAAPDAEVAADGGAITQQGPIADVQTEHVETLYFDILQDVRVLDPAVGSGAFLLAAQDVLLDVYLQCLEFFEELEAEGQGWELASRTRDELDHVHDRKGGKALHAKREIILNNLYGVDIDDGAVEICKLRLWLSMVADIEDEPSEVEPLPNIDFNIRQGNTLIGFTDVQEIATDAGDASLANFGGGIGETIAEMYDDVIDAIDRHRSTDSASEATSARDEAESLIEEYSVSLNEKIVDQFIEAGIDDLSITELEAHDPFHWILEFAPEYADGGFDAIIGNPPWEQLQPSRDDFFPRFDPAFRTRMPNDKDAKQDELLEDPEIRDAWEKHQEDMNRRAEFYKNSPSYELQSPKIDGRTIPSKRELSGLFLERIFEITKPEGYVSQILPSRILTGTSGKDLREHLLYESQLRLLVGFENNGIFDNIDGRFNFAITVFKNSGESEIIESTFKQDSLRILTKISDYTVPVPRSLYLDFSPDVRIFPQIRVSDEVEVLEKLTSHPKVNEEATDTWQIRPYFELNRTTDRDRYVEDRSQGDYPVYGGKNVNQFEHKPLNKPGTQEPEFWSVNEEDPENSAKFRIREKNLRNLKKAIYEEFDGTGSQKQFVNELLETERGKPLELGDVQLDCNEYRIVYRDITQATNERTVLAGVIPQGIVCHDKLHTVRPFRIEPSKEDLSANPLHTIYEREFSDRELFVALGLLNSIPFDYLMRRKTQATIIMYKLKETQMPRLTHENDWFEFISSRAAKLNCYGDQFEAMRGRLGGIESVTEEPRRQELQAEIDAAAFHAYGLDYEDTEFVLDDFHRVKNPRLMNEAYFEMVLDKYDELADSGPHP